MIKSFCDICGEPARSGYPTSSRNIGEKYSATRCDTGGSVVSSMWQRRITTSVEFRDVTKASGADGPPDLCAPCMASLLLDVANKLNAEAIA